MQTKKHIKMTNIIKEDISYIHNKYDYDAKISLHDFKPYYNSLSHLTLHRNNVILY